MKFGLEQHVINILIAVFEANTKVDKAFIFGSRAKGNYRPDSDIDIAIKGFEISTDDIIKMSVAFEEEGIKHKFDLIDYNSIKEPALKDHIDRVGIEFYERWKKIPLSKTTTFIIDNRGKTVPTATEGIPLIATNCINNTSLYPVYENVRYISQDIYDNWFRSHPEPGDIILTLKGSQNGAVCLVPDPFNFAIAQDMVALRTNEKVIYPYFLFAALRSKDVQFQIKNLDVSGVIPHLKKSDFDKLILPFPDMETQKEIGDIYFNLSNKIDLLNRQNKTLEQLAETLFRQWFVEEADESWESGTLADEFEFVMGQSPLGSELNEDKNGMVFYQGRSDFGYRFPTPRIYTTSPTRIAKPLDTLISVRAPVGDMNIAFEECCLGRGVAAFRYKKNNDFYSYTYYKLRSLMESIKQFEDNGSVFGSIGKEDFKKLENTIPPNNKIEKFEKEVKTIDDKILLNEKQIRTLTQTRDTLLPKLMNGEVRVQMSEL